MFVRAFYELLILLLLLWECFLLLLLWAFNETTQFEFCSNIIIILYRQLCRYVTDIQAQPQIQLKYKCMDTDVCTYIQLDRREDCAICESTERPAKEKTKKNIKRIAVYSYTLWQKINAF